MRIPRVEWGFIGDNRNDLVASYGDFVLRIERLNKGIWWYAIYLNKKELVHECDARCKKEAKNKIGNALLKLFV